MDRATLIPLRQIAERKHECLLAASRLVSIPSCHRKEETATRNYAIESKVDEQRVVPAGLVCFINSRRLVYSVQLIGSLVRQFLVTDCDSISVDTSSHVNGCGRVTRLASPPTPLTRTILKNQYRDG